MEKTVGGYKPVKAKIRVNDYEICEGEECLQRLIVMHQTGSLTT